MGGCPRVSRLYLVYRWLVAATVLISTILSLASRAATIDAAKWFFYLTNWARLVGCAATTLEAGLVTRRWHRELHGQVAASVTTYSEQEEKLPASHRMLWSLANINTSLSALVTIVYWWFLYRPDHNTEPLVFLNSLTGHALILVINVFDILISARPWRCLHAYQPVLFCFFYTIANLIYVQCGGTNIRGEPYIYKFLDWSAPSG